jgi:hypothetical protein
MFQAKTINDFLNKEQCEVLLNFVKTTNSWRRIDGDFWDNRTINYFDTPVEIKEILQDSILRLQSFMQTEYSLSRPIYPDTMDLVRWFDGMSQHPHCDDMSDNEKEHSRFSSRYIGCVIYLNDDYEGGKTYYPSHNFEVTPKSGMAAIHLGDCNHRHGVTKVIGNTRYTAASFWGFDKSKAIYGIG